LVACAEQSRIWNLLRTLVGESDMASRDRAVAVTGSPIGDRPAAVHTGSKGPMGVRLAVQSRVLGATSRTITQLPWPLGRS